MTAFGIAERRRRAAALYREGLSLRDVGKRLGVSEFTVRADLKALNKPTRTGYGTTVERGVCITDRTREIAEAHLQGGVSQPALAKKFGISKQAVQRHVAKYRALTTRVA